jgi:RNA polymerase sigma-70 factor, ECF subfamily
LQEAIIFAPKYPLFRMEYQPPGVEAFSADTTAVFERVFKEHFKGLHSYAFTIIKDEADAEEIVQNVFYKLWERREQMAELQSVNAYLYRSVYNESLNYLKHQKVKMAYQSHTVHSSPQASNPADSASLKELETKIQTAMNDLPEQCRTVFQLSRFEELKYREIADRLGISVKTVENQMGKALKVLRTKLAEYLPVIWLLLINLKNLMK